MNSMDKGKWLREASKLEPSSKLGIRDSAKGLGGVWPSLVFFLHIWHNMMKHKATHAQSHLLVLHHKPLIGQEGDILMGSLTLTANGHMIMSPSPQMRSWIDILVGSLTLRASRPAHMSPLIEDDLAISQPLLAHAAHHILTCVFWRFQKCNSLFMASLIFFPDTKV